MTVWPVMKIGRTARLISGVGFPHEYQGRASGSYPFLKVSDLSTSSSGYRIVRAQNWVEKDGLSSLGARLVPEGAIVFPKVGAAMLKNPRRLLDLPAAMDNNMMAIVPLMGESRFWLYALSTIDLGEIAAGGALPYVNEGQVRDLHIPFPELDEQRRIADFLDAETGRLDALLTRRARQTALLQNSEESAITEILDRVAGHATRLKHLATKITSGPRGWGDLAADSGSLFLRITNIPRRGIWLDLRDSLYVDAPPGPERERSRTRVGDVLVSITADIGSVALVDDRGCDGNVSQHIALVRPNASHCSPQWLAYAVKSARSRQMLRMSSYGGTKVGLGLGDIANLVIDVPPLPVQKEMAAQVTDALAQREALSLALFGQIDLLRERRQALITAAVTGQFDVFTASGRNVMEGLPA